MSFNVLGQTNDGKTNLPSILAGSIQVINLNADHIVNGVTADIEDISSRRVTDLDPPVFPSDAANKAYVDSMSQSAAGSDGDIQFNNNGVLGGSSSLTWTTATNTMTLSSGRITGLINPITASDAVNKAYVDSAIAGSLPGGPDNSLQFKSSSNTFAGSSNLLWTTSNNTLLLTGTITLVGNMSFTGTLTNGPLSVTSGNIVCRDITTNTSGHVLITNLDQSTSPTTGALVVAGGVGIGKDLMVAGVAYATKFTATSDIRLKENIIPLDNSLDKLRKIETFKYNFKNKNDINYGFIAQQLEKVGLDELVDSTRSYKAVNYIFTIAMLVDAVKTLDLRLSEMEYTSINNGSNNDDINVLRSKLNNILNSLTTSKINEVKNSIEEEMNDYLEQKEKNINGYLLELFNAHNEKINKLDSDVEEFYVALEKNKQILNKTFQSMNTINKNIKDLSDTIIDLENKINNIDHRSNKIVETLSDNFKDVLKSKIIEYEDVVIEKKRQDSFTKRRKRLSKKQIS